MRIAQVAPLTEAVPPRLYGGTERVVHWLTEELVALGHDVTLFASGDLRTSAKLEAVWPKALRLDGSVRDANALHLVMLERVRQKCDEFDFLHFHLDYYPFSLFSRNSTPFVTTLHGRLDLPEHQPVFTTFSSVPVISISNSQRRPVPQANWIRTIYHGVTGEAARSGTCKTEVSGGSWPHCSGEGHRSRNPDRQTMWHSAEDCGESRQGQIKPISRRLFARILTRRISSTSARSAIGRSQQFLSGAIALLVTIDWPEPFGLVMIEAMACGTPVIAFNRGSVPEVVDDGVTGFIVEDETSAVGEINRLPELDRAKHTSAIRRTLHGAPHGDGIYLHLS